MVTHGRFAVAERLNELDNMEIVQTIGLEKKQLPASAFPTPAEVYVCDKCGRDITKHFFPPHSHSSRRIGPLRYQCQCGEKYVTGAMEWEYMPNGERRGYFTAAVVIGILLLLASAIVGTAAFFVLRYWDRSFATAAATIATTAPAAWWEISLLGKVLASRWRTRVRGTTTALE